MKEFWSNKQNFPSLLNLPDQIEKFGHLGLSWDATFEACLGGIKDLLKSARKNPESLLPRMVLLQKKQHIDILRERFLWHKIRQSLVGSDDLNEPDFKRQCTDNRGCCVVDHRMNTDLLEYGESKRYDGVRIYRNKREVIQRYKEGRFLSGFMVTHQDGLEVTVRVEFNLRCSDML